MGRWMFVICLVFIWRLNVYPPSCLDPLPATPYWFAQMEKGITKHGYPGNVWGAIGDTLHNTTRYGEASGISQTRKDSLGVVYRNWHPGPLGYQVVADTFTFYYTQALLLALDKLEAVLFVY